MENPMAIEVRYQDHRRQAAWLNAENWKFERPEKRRPVRAAVAKALILLATLLDPVRREAHTA